MSDNITIDELVGIIKSEFDNVNKKLGEFDNVKSEFDNVNMQLKELRQGQENIELKLTNVAYRFELQDLQAQLKTLKERVDYMEKK